MTLAGRNAIAARHAVSGRHAATGRVAIGDARIFSAVDITAAVVAPEHGGTPSAEGYGVTGTRVDTYVDRWGNIYGQPPFNVGGQDKLLLDSSSVLGGRDALVTDPSVHGTLGLSWLYSLTGGPIGTGDYSHFWVGQLTSVSTVGGGFDTAAFVGQIALNMVGIGTRNTGALATGPSQSSDVIAVADLSAPHIYEETRIGGVRFSLIDGVYQSQSTCTVSLVGYQGIGSSQVASHPGQQAKTWGHYVAARNAVTPAQRMQFVAYLSAQFGIYL